MKNLIAAALMFLTVSANAGPYFRVIDPSHPQPVIGALLAPENVENSEAASLLPLITHSPADGCAFPSIVCADWTPLAVGASMTGGNVTFNVAPLMNVLPWMSAAATAILPSDWYGAQGILRAEPYNSITFSAGPVWQYRQATNKGYLRVFTGLALHF